MKKPLLFLAVTTAALTLIISGCSKKTDASAITVASLAGSYKLTALSITYSGMTVDGMTLIDDCQKDDVTQFKADSTYIYTDAGTTCNPDGSSSGTWTVSHNYLITDGKDSATIKSYNGKTLVLTQAGNYGGVNATGTSTFTKQ